MSFRDPDELIPGIIPCRLCGQPTHMLGTKLCDGCWELETRIHMHPELARKILATTKSRPKTLLAGLTKVQREKADILLLYFNDKSPNGKSICEEDGFYKLYYWLFRKYPYWYSWAYFYRDHGFVGLRKS